MAKVTALLVARELIGARTGRMVIVGWRRYIVVKRRAMQRALTRTVETIGLRGSGLEGMNCICGRVGVTVQNVSFSSILRRQFDRKGFQDRSFAWIYGTTCCSERVSRGTYI